MQRSRSVTRFLAVGLAVAGLGLSGCGDPEGPGDREASGGSEPAEPTEPTEPTDRRIAVDVSSLEPAGTELAPGIEVQPGSSLVARTFPLLDFHPQTADGRMGIGWQAVVVVEGDPVEVWDRYAEAMDIAGVGSAVHSCVVARVERLGELGTAPGKQERFLTEAAIEGENRMRCMAGTSGGTAMTMAVGVSQEACNGDRVEDCVVRPTSHLLLQKRTAPDPTGFQDGDRFGTDELRFERGMAIMQEQGGDDGTGPQVPVEPVPIPAGSAVPPDLDDPVPGSRLPGSGEPFDDGLDPYLNGIQATKVNRVPDGGSSLVAPAMLIDCNSGLVAVLRVPLGYKMAQTAFDEADDTDDPMWTLQLGTDATGRDWIGGQITTAGGYYLGVIALQEDPDVEDSSIVLLTECGD